MAGSISLSLAPCLASPSTSVCSLSAYSMSISEQGSVSFTATRKSLSARRAFRELYLPADAVNVVRSSHCIEDNVQVLGPARERPDCGNVGIGRNAGKRVALGRDHSPSGFQAEHTTVMRGVADGRADVAAGID